MNLKTQLLLLSMTLLVATSSLFSQGWVQKGHTPFDTDHSNGYSYDGKAYVIEGSPDISGQNRLWEFDPETQIWTFLKNFEGPGRSLAIGDAFDGKYYFGFGFGANEDLSDLWVFDAADLSFTQLPSCPCIGRGHPALIAHNDKIYMGSGSSADGDLNDWWEYDMITQVWVEKQRIPGEVRHHPFFFGSGDKVYVGGGHVESWHSYDMIANEWSAIDDLPQGRVAGTQIDYNGQGFLIGGDTESHGDLPIEESFMRYDPLSQEWEYLPSLPEGSRWAPSSFIVNDELYFFGGVAYGDAENTPVWSFDLNQLNCLPAINMNAFDITDSSANLIWLTNSFSNSDTLKYRKIGTTEWTDIPNPQAVFTLENLEECTVYEFTIFSQCDSLLSYSNSYEFLTKGCGACIDAEYCTNDEIIGGTDYINAFGINDYLNESGNNGGYANFTLDPSQDINIGEEFELYFDPASNFGLIDLNFSVWVDLDANGEFENNERIFASANVQGPINTTVLIPEDAVEGPSRLRLTFIYQEIGTACGNTNYGEVEDYCINLKKVVSTEDIGENLSNDILVSPNPFEDKIKISVNNAANQLYDLTILSPSGETVWSKKKFDLNSELNIDFLSSGIYFLKCTDGSNNTRIKKIIKH